jgi:pimeloyl-ACP methyl ester carboxylesterase
MMVSSLLILVIHGGAFVGGGPNNVRAQADALQRLAPTALVDKVAYPAGRPARAYRYVRAIARARHGPVVAYGFSSGGYIAARLAAQGDVRAAVTVAGVYHLDAWARFSHFPHISRVLLGLTTAADRRSGELRPGPRAAPHLMLHGDRDLTTPLADARAYAREDPRARLVVMHGVGHEEPTGPVLQALRWLVDQAAGPTWGPPQFEEGFRSR